MKGVHVDPSSRRVRAQAGLNWKEFNRATHAFGLATTGGVISSTGIAGLTLGGGLGWTMAKYGMAVDNLTSAEIVTADGQVRTASADDDPDLFWAVRGGGGNFGVASSFEYEVHPLSNVLAGLIAFPLADAPKIFDFFRDFTIDLPDDLLTMAALVHAPDGSGLKISALGVCHCGDQATAERDVTPVKTVTAPLIDMIGPMPYPVVNTLLDDGFPKGARNYWKSAFFKELSDDAVAIMVHALETAPSIMSGMVVEHFHGLVTRIAPTDTAYPFREPGYNLVLTGEWMDPADDDANISWVRETFAALQPHMADTAYVNYLDGDDGNRVRNAYGLNWERLVELKRRYDPDNLFRLNQNIDPAG
jgi:FAD/FMN-containing dehydrogenase